MCSTLLVFIKKQSPSGKLTAPSLNAAEDGRGLKSRRLFVSNLHCGGKRLVDSQANITVLPPDNQEKLATSSILLFPANGYVMKSCGKCPTNLYLGLKVNFPDLSLPLM